MSSRCKSGGVTVKYLFPLKFNSLRKNQKVVKRAVKHEPKYFDALLADDATSEEIENYTGVIEYKDRKKK